MGEQLRVSGDSVENILRIGGECVRCYRLDWPEDDSELFASENILRAILESLGRRIMKAWREEQ